jgi:hypothetical protein
MSYLAATTLMLSLALSSLAQAQNVDLKKLKEPVKPQRSGERGNAGGMKACPEYGAGFYKMPGSDTCIRIGGAVDVGVGMSSTRR